MSAPEHMKSKQINIELGEKEAEGIYSNLALITHSPAEFVIDFTRMLPGTQKAKVFARIIMTPQHAKSLLRALEDNIKKYESQHGDIKMVTDSRQPEKTMGFQPEPSQTQTTDGQ